MDAPGGSRLHRRNAEPLGEQTAQMTLAHAKASGQIRDRSGVERAIGNQTERPIDGRPGSPPCGAPRPRRGMAPPARAIPLTLGFARASEERHVGRSGQRRGAHRPAVDAGGPNRDDEASVEAGIPLRPGLFAGAAVERHEATIAQAGGGNWTFSDISI